MFAMAVTEATALWVPVVEGKVCTLVPVIDPYGATAKTPKSEKPPHE